MIDDKFNIVNIKYICAVVTFSLLKEDSEYRVDYKQYPILRIAWLACRPTIIMIININNSCVPIGIFYSLTITLNALSLHIVKSGIYCNVQWLIHCKTLRQFAVIVAPRGAGQMPRLTSTCRQLAPSTVGSFQHCLTNSLTFAATLPLQIYTCHS